MSVTAGVLPGICPRGHTDTGCHGGWPAGIRPHMVCRVAYAGSNVAGPDACQERGGSMPERVGSVPERAGPVKLQTKGDDGLLLCSDRHSSPGELRIAKGQTSAGKMPNAGQVPISGNVRLVPQAH